MTYVFTEVKCVDGIGWWFASLIYNINWRRGWDGEEHPIAYASRTLSPAEKKYSQIEKEALSVIYGVKKFHQYLWGRSFNLMTDHKPLVTLFGEHKHFPMMAAARIQRWAIILSAYDYHICYRKSENHGMLMACQEFPCLKLRMWVQKLFSTYQLFSD